MRTQNGSNVDMQEVARDMFMGIAPERRDDLDRLWRTHLPKFRLLAETAGQNRFVMQTWIDSGVVEFSGQAQRAFWLGVFAAWEGYSRVSEFATTGKASFARLAQMHEAFGRILHSNDPWAIEMPEGVPEPERFGDLVGEDKLIGDLAVFAIGWALLHEIGHLQHPREGTVLGEPRSTDDRHNEEFSCDAFATNFLLQRVGEFADAESQDAAKVRSKREMGIYAALFVLTLLGPGVWPESESHPTLQKRIDAVVEIIGGSGSSMSGAVALGAFSALKHIWPRAPGPVFALLEGDPSCSLP